MVVSRIRVFYFEKVLGCLRLGAEQFAKFDRANIVSDWADDDISILKQVKTDAVPTLRELALSASRQENDP